MMPRPQFTLRALLVLMLAAGCFFGGMRFERERRREDESATGRTRYFNDKGQIAKPGEPISEIRHKILPLPTSRAPE
jgi:hypothetical protein